MKDNNCYLDTTLYEVAYWYMKRKRMDMTTGNLFWIMEKICARLEQVNKNRGKDKIRFIDNICVIPNKTF